MGKGSGRRPSDISRSDMEAKWDAAFGPRAIETAASPAMSEEAPVEEQTRKVQAYCPECGTIGTPHFASELGCISIETAAPPSFLPDSEYTEEQHAEMARDWEEEINAEAAKPERDPYWTGPGYRGEYTCPCGVGHGRHVHGCCGKNCCTREDFPLRLKDIPGHKGLYSITRTGQVWSHPGKSNHTDGMWVSLSATNGYRHVQLWKNGVGKHESVHRLVAITYLPNPEGKPEINHKDANRGNNNVDNLEWVTTSENIQHCYSYGRRTGPSRKLTPKAAKEARKLYATGTYSGQALADKYGVHAKTMWSLLQQKTYKDAL